MDIRFQDIIDEYLLHGDRMSPEEREQFLGEVGQNAEKSEQLEFTENVMNVIRSREEKLRELSDMEEIYGLERAGVAMSAMCACPPSGIPEEDISEQDEEIQVASPPI